MLDSLALFNSHSNFLQPQVNRAMFLGIYELESHFAIYRAGVGYARHVDQVAVTSS